MRFTVGNSKVAGRLPWHSLARLQRQADSMQLGLCKETVKQSTVVEYWDPFHTGFNELIIQNLEKMHLTLV